MTLYRHEREGGPERLRNNVEFVKVPVEGWTKFTALTDSLAYNEYMVINYTYSEDEYISEQGNLEGDKMERDFVLNGLVGKVYVK